MSTERELETTEYLVPRHAVDQLFESLNIVRNELSEVFDIPTTDTADWDKYAMDWWNNQPLETQHVLRSAMSSLGSPIQVVNMSVMKQDTQLIDTRAVYESLELSDPAFLIGEDDERNNYVVVQMPNGSMLMGTMLLYLDAAADIGKSDTYFTIPTNDFFVFLGIMDLYRKKKLQELLSHEASEFKTSYQEILDMMTELMDTMDYRWILPFSTPVFPEKPEAFTMDNVVEGVAKLTSIEVLASDGTNILLSEGGLVMADTMMYKKNMLRIVTLGMDESGKPAGASAIYVRGDPLLWFIDVGADVTTIASVDYEQAGSLLEAILTPEKPKAQKGEAAPMCPKCGKPATWVEAYKRWYCYTCQEYLDV